MKHRIHKITHLALALALGAGLGASRANAQALPVTDGLQVWLSADGVDPADPTQVDGSGNVQQWNDLSGNSNHATNPTASERPTFVTNAMNGKPVLRFTEATSSKLFLGDLSASFWASGLPTVVDSSPTAVNSGTGGAAINGTYVNIPNRGVTGALVGDSDTATSLNGSTQEVQIPWSAELNPATAGLSDPFTVEAWVKSDGAPAGSRIIVQSMRQPGRLGTVNDIPNDRSGWFLRHIGNDLQFAVGTATGAPFYYYYTIPGAVSATNWQHVVVVYDGDETPVIYIDKVPQKYVLTRQDGLPFEPGEAESIRVRQNTDCPAIIGNRAFGGWGFNGVIDEVAIYASALSQSRIQAHFENGMNAPTPRTQPYSAEVLADAPVGYYRMNEPASNSPVAGASFFAVAAPNNDGRYNLFGNRPNDDRWVANTWTESSPGSFREGRAGFGAAGYALWPQSGANVYSLESSPAQYRFVLNGNPNPALTTTGAYNSGAGANWTIGDSAAGNNQLLNGDIAEMILFNRVLTPLEADQVGGYLSQKYGLNTAYPPTNLTVTVTNPVDGLAYPNNTPLEASATVTAGSLDDSQGPYTVEFWVDGTLAGTDTSEPYSLDLGILSNGSHEIYAKVTDSSSTPLTATSSTHSFTVVTAIATTTTLTSSANPSTYGSGTLTATVVAANSSVLTGGTVQFFDGGEPLGEPVPVDTDTGEASYSINLLGAGSREIIATYSGFDGRTASSAPAISQVVNKAPLTVTAKNVFRPTETSNLDPLPSKITGFQNGQTLATSGVAGQPLLTTPAVLSSPAGEYTITCALGDLAAENYSFTLVDGILTVADVPDTFSINFFVGPDWPYGGLGAVGNEEAKEALKIEPGMPAGLGDWFTSGWTNYLVPWAPTSARPPLAVTSNRGSTATFTLIDCRNGWTYSGAARTTLVGDGNGNMMDAHVNSTLDPDNGVSNSFRMEMSDIPFAAYDVIFYMGASQAQFGDGKGAIVFNGGPERDFTLKPGAFDGTFTEMVDETTPGNYIVFEGVTGSSFTVQTYGKGPTGFNHIGPFGFQIAPVGPAIITTFDIPGAEGIIDQSTKTISLTVPAGTNLATLAPTFTLSSGICNQSSGEPPSPTFALQNPATYTVTDNSTDPAIINDYTVTVTVEAATTTLVIDLGSTPGTVIEGGTFIGTGPTNLPLPELPPGSILRSIAVNTTLVATDNENFPNDLTVLLDPTPETPGDDFSLRITGPTPTHIFGPPTATLTWADGAGSAGTPLIDTKTHHDWPDVAPIDLATTGLFLGNAYGGPTLGGTWSGTITLTYDQVEAGSPYENWAGGEPFAGDANGDGVSNGLAFLLGAANPQASVLGLLPAISEDDGGLVLSFSMLNAASRGTAVLSVEHSSDLGNIDPWSAVFVPETTTSVDGVSFTVTPGSPLNGVTAIVPHTEASGGKLFGRLSVKEN